MLQPLSLRSRAGHPGGVTLIELMIVLAVAATLVVLTAPSFKRMIDVQRLRSINAALVTDLQFARGEAASRNQNVFIEFDKTDANVTCYVIFTGNREFCDCRASPVCTGSGTKEIRTVQVSRSQNITVGVPSTQTIEAVGFDPATGRLLVIPVDVVVEALAPFRIEVKHPDVGGFIDELEVTGRPIVCSPSGQVSGVPACP